MFFSLIEDERGRGVISTCVADSTLISGMQSTPLLPTDELDARQVSIRPHKALA